MRAFTQACQGVESVETSARVLRFFWASTYVCNTFTTEFVDGSRFAPKLGLMRIKTTVKSSAALFMFALSGATTSAAPGDAMTLARDFATCQGRYAAQVDYDGLMGREIGEAAQHAAMFAELVETVMPIDAAPDALETIYTSRQGALGVHWNLLHSADFAFNDRLATHARNKAQRDLQMCNMLVLG